MALAVLVALSACARVDPGEARPIPGLDSGCDAAMVLLFDVSASMQATDVTPDRLTAARQASKSFADRLPKETRLGLVEFAGTTTELVAPTTDRDIFKAGLDHLEMNERTGTGAGIFTALSSIRNLPAAGPPARPARIVLLSDGKQTVPESLDDPRGAYTAAREANRANVHISSIALGTDHGVVDLPNPGRPSSRVSVSVDQDSLREISRLTGGSFYAAVSLDELNKAFDDLTCHR
ncbi:VWA domain-containing protein [Nocardia sp. NPDC051052]|uniref:VWA domain-containing protein n=1 Tax=Nocardia sp. NPDC051052 TaxID=3364322 RepID=UPI0037A9A98D